MLASQFNTKGNRDREVAGWKTETEYKTKTNITKDLFGAMEMFHSIIVTVVT